MSLYSRKKISKFTVFRTMILIWEVYPQYPWRTDWINGFIPSSRAVSAPRIYAVLNSRHNQSLDSLLMKHGGHFFSLSCQQHCRISTLQPWGTRKITFLLLCRIPQEFRGLSRTLVSGTFPDHDCQFCHHHYGLQCCGKHFVDIISRSVSLFSGKQSDKLIVACDELFCSICPPNALFLPRQVSEWRGKHWNTCNHSQKEPCDQ